MREEFAHKCPECGRRWTHKGCDGFGNPTDPAMDVCCECGSAYSECIYEDEFLAYAKGVTGEAARSK